MPFTGLVVAEKEKQTFVVAVFQKSGGRKWEKVCSHGEQDSTAVPNFAYRSFCPCGNLVGECLPQTLLMRLTPLEKFPQILFGLFQKQFRYTPRFSPISERTPRTERRSADHEKIQHTAPQPGSQDTHDRGRITAFLPLTAGERISPLPVCTKKEPA